MRPYLSRYATPIVLAVLVLAQTNVVLAQGVPTQVGRWHPMEAGSPHPYPAGRGKAPVWSATVEHPGASYIALHFERFELEPGDRVVIRSPDGRRPHILAGRGRSDRTAFWAPHVKGERLVVELFASGRAGNAWGVSIDRYAAGDPDLLGGGATEAAGAFGATEAVCSLDDREDVACYQSKDPPIYEHSQAVARLLIEGIFSCTGWLVGCQGHLITNSHCIDSPMHPGDPASAVANTDYEFLVEAPGCGTACPSCGGVVWNGQAELIRHDPEIDYALIQLTGDPQIEYGSLLLDNRVPEAGERIYVPQHPGGRLKEVGVRSSDPSDESGFCEILGTGEPPCTGGDGDVGYLCDTEGGSSGSPVIAYSDHRVIALHHCADCPNRGVPIQAVIQDLGELLPSCALEPGPHVVADSLTVDDTAGNFDGVADPGEWLELQVDLRNVGAAAATGVTAILETGDPRVTIVAAAAAWPDLAPGEMSPAEAGAFAVVLDRTVVCGESLELKVSVASDQQTFVIPLALLVGQNLAPSLILQSVDTPLSIPDASELGVLSSLTVTDSFLLGDLNVALDLQHTWISDLQIELRSPVGTMVRLHDRTGGSGDDLLTTYDLATPPDGPGTMEDFLGEDLSGTWELLVVDLEPYDIGNIAGWSLQAEGVPEFACDASPGEVGSTEATVPFELTSERGVRFEPLPEPGLNYHLYGASSGDAILNGAWTHKVCDLERNGSGVWSLEPSGVVRWDGFDPLPQGAWVVVAERPDPFQEGLYGFGSDGLPRVRDLDGRGALTNLGCP